MLYKIKNHKMKPLSYLCNFMRFYGKLWEHTTCSSYKREVGVKNAI